MFYQCNSLTEITIPNTVKAMEQQAFYYCSQLSKVTFAEGNDSNGLILTGGVYGSQYGTSYYPVFDRCDNLTQIAFPKRLETLGAYALCSTNISQITFSEGGLLTLKRTICPEYVGNFLRSHTRKRRYDRRLRVFKVYKADLGYIRG